MNNDNTYTMKVKCIVTKKTIYSISGKFNDEI